MGILDALRGRFADQRIRRIIKDAGISTAASGVGAVLGIVRSIVLARYLGVTDFGRLAIIVAATVVTRQFLSVRTWEWVTVQLSRAHVARDGERAGSVMRAGWALGGLVNGLAALLILALASWIAGSFLEEGALANVLRLNALSLIVIAFDDASLAAMRVLGRFRWLAVYNVLAAAARVGLLVPVIVLDLGLGGVVAASVAIQALCSVILFVATHASLADHFGGPLGGRIGPVLVEWRAHARMLAVMSVTDTVKTFSNDGDALVIGWFAGAASAGPYRAAWTIVNGLQQLAVPLYMVFYPEMTKAAAAGDHESLRRLVRQTAVLGFAGGVLAALALTIAAPFLVPLLYGAEFADAARLLQIMSWALLILSVQWANPLFVSVGRPSWTLYMVLVQLVVKLGLLFALVPSWQHHGAAVAYMAYGLVTIPAAILLARRAPLPRPA
jgi:O-antigen/teichoic acid export membrane protein